MKRDLDLIRNILEVIESKFDGLNSMDLEAFTKWIPQATKATIHGHLKLLLDENFIYGKQHFIEWLIIGLTWKGHNFLANAKNEIIWEKVIKLCDGNLSFDIVYKLINDAVQKEAESSFRITYPTYYN
jgi:hypothetical protein